MKPRHTIPDILNALAKVNPDDVSNILKRYPGADQIEAKPLDEVRAWHDECIRKLKVSAEPRQRMAWLTEWLVGEHKLLGLDMRRYALLRQYGPAGMDQWEIGYGGGWDGKPGSVLRHFVWWLDASRDGIALYRARIAVAMQDIDAAQVQIDSL